MLRNHCIILNDPAKVQQDSYFQGSILYSDVDEQDLVQVSVDDLHGCKFNQRPVGPTQGPLHVGLGLKLGDTHESDKQENGTLNLDVNKLMCEVNVTITLLATLGTNENSQIPISQRLKDSRGAPFIRTFANSHLLYSVFRSAQQPCKRRRAEEHCRRNLRVTHKYSPSVGCHITLYN